MKEIPNVIVLNPDSRLAKALKKASVRKEEFKIDMQKRYKAGEFDKYFLK